MSKTNRLNGFPVPETAARYGVAEGRPLDKRTKTIESYRRLMLQLTSGEATDGEPLSDSDTEILHRIVSNRADRLQQLAGGKTEIMARNRKERVDMLRRSTNGKLQRFEAMESSTLERY